MNTNKVISVNDISLTMLHKMADGSRHNISVDVAGVELDVALIVNYSEERIWVVDEHIDYPEWSVVLRISPALSQGGDLLSFTKKKTFFMDAQELGGYHFKDEIKNIKSWIFWFKDHYRSYRAAHKFTGQLPKSGDIVPLKVFRMKHTKEGRFVENESNVPPTRDEFYLNTTGDKVNWDVRPPLVGYKWGNVYISKRHLRDAVSNAYYGKGKFARPVFKHGQLVGVQRANASEKASSTE